MSCMRDFRPRSEPKQDTALGFVAGVLLSAVMVLFLLMPF